MQEMNCTLKSTLEKYYSEAKEKDRLATSNLERDRTLKILSQSMPAPPATILDIGGAAGAYAFPLAKQGYKVHLVDLIPLHIEQAKEYAQNASIHLASYTVGDARHINMPDGSVDAILLFGPLYHLMHAQDRLDALKESYRLLKHGGTLFAVAISRFATLMDSINKGHVYARLENLKQDLLTGMHWKTSAHGHTSPYLYLHYPHQFKEEIISAGFHTVKLKSIEGPIWQEGIINDLCHDAASWKDLISILETIEEEESIVGASAHIMSVSKK